MFAIVLGATLVLVSMATVFVLADSGLRWWSAFGLLRQRRKIGYATTGFGPRPAAIACSTAALERRSRTYPIIRRPAQRAA